MSGRYRKDPSFKPYERPFDDNKSAHKIPPKSIDSTEFKPTKEMEKDYPVRVLFLRNVKIGTTQEEIKKLFEKL